MSNPNTSNKKAFEYMKRNPEYREWAISWLKRRKYKLKTRYKRKYEKSRSNTSEVPTDT